MRHETEDRPYAGIYSVLGIPIVFGSVSVVLKKPQPTREGP